MYRVIVKSKSEHDSVVLGARYCFRKKSAAHLIATFTECNCDFDIEQLIRIQGDIFCWSDCDISEKIWDMAYDMLDEWKQK